ncbi:MAG: hypothetical protein AAGJ10_19910 [Bacteroidota bacterium]
MTYRIHIDPERRRIAVYLHGPVDEAVLRDAIQETWAHADYDPTFDGLLDLRHAVMRIAASDVYGLVTMIRRSEQHLRGRFAFVSTHPFATAMSMLYEYRSHAERQVGVFSSLEAAEAWLDAAAAA